MHVAAAEGISSLRVFPTVDADGFRGGVSLALTGDSNEHGSGLCMNFFCNGCVEGSEFLAVDSEKETLGREGERLEVVSCGWTVARKLLLRRSGSSEAESLWLASTPSKRWGEIFFLVYTPFWLILCLGIVVPYRLYERFTELDYLLLGLVSALPSFLLPFVLVGKGDKSKHWFERYWAKASLWIIIFSYVGNYFWTHYFFAVLGASYTFPSWRMNNVPHTTFLLTHACFLFYHVASNITLRRVRHAISDLSSHVRWAIQAIWILTLSYIIALLETYAIANFPYYDFVDRAAMYKVGCLFYAIYFIVSFPMFIRLDEKPNDPWSLSRTAIDSLAAAMIVTIILDLWRLYLGPIVEIPTSIPYKECLSYGLPWMS